MKSLLIALGLALSCLVQANQDMSFADSDLSKVNGKWFVVAIVTSCQKLKEMLPHMPASPVSFEQKSADEVQMIMDMATPKGCKPMRPVLKRENGVFSTLCGQGGKKTVGDINYSENAMMTDISLSHQKGQCGMATLSVRNLSDVQGALKELKLFADRHGLAGEKIYVLSTERMCPRSS